MKTRILFVAVMMLAAGPHLLTGQSNVYSANVVGYVNLPLAGGRYTSVANPLNTTNNTFGNLLSRLPNFSKILKWDHAIADFYVFNKGCGFGDWCPGAGEFQTLNPGEGVLILTPRGFTNLFVAKFCKET